MCIYIYIYIIYLSIYLSYIYIYVYIYIYILYIYIYYLSFGCYERFCRSSLVDDARFEISVVLYKCLLEINFYR